MKSEHPYSPLPDSDVSLILRTDYAHQAAWDEIKHIIAQPVDGFQAYVEYVDDAQYDGISSAQVIELFSGAGRSFAMVADARAMTDPEHPLLIIDIFNEAHREFRSIPMGIQSVENNLSIANLDFADFADAADPDGVFRNFRI